MKLATTTGDFHFYFDSYKDCLKHVCAAGFRYVDLSMYALRTDDPLLVRSDWKDTARELKECANELGAAFVQAHSPGGNPLAGDSKAEELINATIRSVEVCGELGIPNIVVHAGMLPKISKQESFALNKAFFTRLFPAMEKHNVNVLCENSTKANMGDMYFTNSGADMKEFVEYVDHPLFHACWDTGHANIEGNQYDEIMTLGADLYALHINDNRGSGDEHLIPYFGTVNMDDIMHALIDSGYKGYFTFESGSTLRTAKYWQGNRRTFDKDDRLREPELFMQTHLEKLMYEIGVHILKKYDCFEE